MKTIKPLRLSVLHRTFDQGGRCVFVPTLLVFFPFEWPSVALQEVALWKFVAAELGPTTPLDECAFKSRGEVIVLGKAYPPGGTPQPVCAVRVQIGSVDKQLYVVGDRHWTRNGPSEPTPYAEMPIDWPHAFGGEGFAANPLGRGFKPTIDPATGERVQLLPNVEYPKALVQSPSDRPEPAGLRPIDLTWPQRFAKIGTYDAKWLKERYPGYAEDLDPSFFNVAPADQWIDGYFRGDESFVLEHLHPTEPRIESRLPGLRARCFITREGDAAQQLEEIELRIDTVQLLPHRKRGVVIFRGATEVSEDDAADVKVLLGAVEKMGEPRPLSHYQTVLAQRLDPKRGYLYVLRDRDLAPERDPAAPRFDEDVLGDEELLGKRDNLLITNMRHRAEDELAALKQSLAGMGLNPDEHLPQELPPPQAQPTLDELPDYVDDQLAQIAQKRAEAKEAHEKSMDEARALCAENGIDFEQAVADAQRKSAGPPKYDAEEEYQKIVDAVQLGRNAGNPLLALEQKLQDPELRGQLQTAERTLKNAYRRFAQNFPAASRLDGSEAERVRSEVEQALRARQSLAERDLTGADLSGLDLRGADLRGAFLEAASLAKADLRGADLTAAVLTRADLTEARFGGAKVARVNFGEAVLHDTDLSGGLDLTKAVFSRARFAGADLRGATLDGADFLDAVFEGADFSGTSATGLTFLNGDMSPVLMRGVRLSGCQLRRCNFLGVDVQGLDLSGANVADSVFYAVKADGANFDQADCSRLKAVGNSSFAGATFRHAKLEQANIRDANLRGCDFSEAQLSGADLSGSNLEAATLEHARAPRAMLVKANLKGANLTRIDLLDGSLQKANIEAADFRGANLFRVDFAKVKGDDGTNFEGANMKHIRFVRR
jgi:uncharacterized protein YjbI with pentapeptide repeats